MKLLALLILLAAFIAILVLMRRSFELTDKREEREPTKSKLYVMILDFSENIILYIAWFVVLLYFYKMLMFVWRV